MTPLTVVVPVSPIPSHPDTAVLDETLASIRHHLPDVEIIVTFDGVRPEDEHRRPDYTEFTRRMIWHLDHVDGHALPMVFDQHEHQTGMMRAALHEIRTPLLMYVEADTPLVTDQEIDFDNVSAFVESGRSNVVRLHHEAVIPADHDHMMLDYENCQTGYSGGDYLQTSQWSQRPHVASVAFYRRIMDGCFTPRARSFIEDRMHGVVDEAFRTDGLSGWNQYRLHIYDPGEGNMKRSYHLDGRAGGPKYDATQVY